MKMKQMKQQRWASESKLEQTRVFYQEETIMQEEPGHLTSQASNDYSKVTARILVSSMIHSLFCHPFQTQTPGYPSKKSAATVKAVQNGEKNGISKNQWKP
jgi:hypothetical protein